MQRAMSSNAAHHQQVGFPSGWMNDSNRGVREEHRILSSSSGSSLSTYSTGTYGDREVFSCLQWDCEPGYYSESLPLCYHGDFTPSDDYRGEESDVNECSYETCCEIEETDVYTCKQYPHSCPTGYETLLVACTLGATDRYPICGEGACCGATPTPVGGVNPDGPSTVSTWAPIGTNPTPQSATRPPTPVPLSTIPPVQPTPTPTQNPTQTPTPAPTQTPTQTPTRTPTRTPPTNAPGWGTQPAARVVPAPSAALPPTRTPVAWVEPAASPSTPTISKASPASPPPESPAASTTVPISWTTAPRPVVNEPAIAPEPSNGRPVPEPVPPAVTLLSGWPEPPTWAQAPWQEVPSAPVQETTAQPAPTTSAPTPVVTLQPTPTITEEPSSAPTSWTEQPATEPPLETPRPSTGAPVTSPTLWPTAGPVVPPRPGTPSPTMPYVTEAPLPETLAPRSTPSPSRTPPPVTKAPDIGAATDAPDVAERTAVASPPPTDLTTKDPVSTPIPDNPSTSVPAEDASVAPATAPESAATVLSTVAPSSPPISLPGEPEKYLRQAAVAANTMSILVVIGIIGVLMGTLFAGTGVGSASSRATSMMEVAGARSATSVRAPSTTMALVLTGQLQFLATLSLVDSTGAADSLVSEFTDHLRWFNLWPPEDVVTEFTQLSTARRLQEATGGGFKCMFAEAESGDIGAIVCAGNLMLLLGILLSIFIVHLAVASGVEAYWLTKQHAEEMVELAGHRALPVRDLSISRWGKSVVRVYPNTSSTDEVARPPTSRRLRQRHSQSTLSPEGRSDDRKDHFSEDDDEEEGCPTPSCGEGRSSLVSECRDRSHSAWLHFPHIELVFLFFGFEGAFAAEVSALRESWCPWVMFMAVAALVLYPALMFVMVCRIIFIRVRPDDLIVFESVPDAEDSDGSSCEDRHNEHRRSLFSRVKLGWDESSSLFSWADKGQWTTTDTADEETRREGDWFRIGFEPLFVDFTKRGSWFMAYSLAQSAALASVGILVDESARQLWLFCGLHLVCCILLVLFKPFANRLINTVGACLAGADAICMAILAVSVLAWEGTENATKADKAVMIIQLLVLIALVIPMYVDASAFFIEGVRERLKRKTAEARAHSAEGERRFVRRYIRRAWPSTWCSMVGKNMFACVADTSAGVRRPRPSTSATSPASMRKEAADKTAAQEESFPVRRRKVPPPPSP